MNIVKSKKAANFLKLWHPQFEYDWIRKLRIKKLKSTPNQRLYGKKLSKVLSGFRNFRFFSLRISFENPIIFLPIEYFEANEHHLQSLTNIILKPFNSELKKAS